VTAPPSTVESLPPLALPAGTRLLTCEIVRVLAGNPFGVIYEARDTIGGEALAVKEYLPAALARRGADGLTLELRAPSHAAAYGRGLRAFIDEARLFERVHHPSLLRIERCFEAHGTAFRVMPLYRGHRLIDIRRAMDEPPDEPALRGLLEGLLGALEALHATRAIHGDIHPGSILLLPDDTPVLLDAGAVQRAIEGEEARSLIKLMGPAFAAPEQRAAAPGAATGPWTDLYALAAVVRYCIGGRLPDPGSVQMSDAKQSLAEVLREQSARHPHLRFSRSFIAAIEAALMPAPEKRPQSVAQMRALLAGDALAPGGAAHELLDENNEPVLGAAALDELAAAAPAPPDDAPPHTPRRDDLTQARTLAALQVALDTIATDTPAAHEPMYDRPVPPSKRPRGPLERRSHRPAAMWAIGLSIAVGVGAVIGMLATQRDAGPLGRAPAAPPASDVARASAPVVLADEPPAAGPAPVPAASPVAAPAPAVAEPVAAAPPAPLVVPLDSAPASAATPATPVTATAPASTATPPTPAPRAVPASAPRPARPVARESRAAGAPAKPAVAAVSSPREACGERTPFALYRCMSSLCAQPRWQDHPQCKRLRETDEVDGG